jgi:hypothetical protein
MFEGKTPTRVRIDSQEALVSLIEDTLERLFDGYPALFMRGSEANSPAQWAELVLGSIDEDAYDIAQFGRSEAVAAIRTIKDKYRQEVLLRIAQDHIYSGGGAPWGVDNLRDRMTEIGTYLEPADDGVLEAIFATGGRFAKTKIEVARGNLELSDGENVVVVMDHHQNKHQLTKIPEFPPYTGEPGSKFAQGKGLDWHREHTVPVVHATVAEALAEGLVGPGGASYSPAKDAIDGIIYDLTISYDPETGKFVGSYHCNPVASE